MSWVIGGYTLPDGDSPLPDSTWPEEQEDATAEVTPIGATGTDATIVQQVSRPSKQAVLHLWCTAATKTALDAKRRTTVTITDAFGGSGSWYFKNARAMRWTSSQTEAWAGADQRFHYYLELVGR